MDVEDLVDMTESIVGRALAILSGDGAPDAEFIRAVLDAYERRGWNAVDSPHLPEYRGLWGVYEEMQAEMRRPGRVTRTKTPAKLG